MTLNSRPFTIIALLCLKKTRSGFVARRGLSVSVYYSIAMYELTSGIVSATKKIFSPSVSSGGYVFSKKNLQVENEESSYQHESLCKDFPSTARPSLKA